MIRSNTVVKNGTFSNLKLEPPSKFDEHDLWTNLTNFLRQFVQIMVQIVDQKKKRMVQINFRKNYDLNEEVKRESNKIHPRYCDRSGYVLLRTYHRIIPFNLSVNFPGRYIFKVITGNDTKCQTSTITQEELLVVINNWSGLI